MALGARKERIYELYCPSCNTSAPPEMRRCIHCGGSLTTSDGAHRLRGVASGHSTRHHEAAEETALIAEPIEASGGGEADEETAPRRRGSRSLGLLWLLMAVAASLYRACAGAE